MAASLFRTALKSTENSKRRSATCKKCLGECPRCERLETLRQAVCHAIYHALRVELLLVLILYQNRVVRVKMQLHGTPASSHNSNSPRLLVKPIKDSSSPWQSVSPLGGGGGRAPERQASAAMLKLQGAVAEPSAVYFDSKQVLYSPHKKQCTRCTLLIADRPFGGGPLRPLTRARLHSPAYMRPPTVHTDQAGK